MYDSMKRHEVHVLKKAGLTLDAIARTTGMSRRTVARIARRTPEPAESPPLVTSERPVGRPSCSDPYAGLVRKTLEAEPGLPTVELLHRARNAGYTGGKTALYALAASLRTGTVSPIVRFEGLAGEFSQHDFGQVDVRYYGTGETERIHFFASRLKWSRWSHVALVPDERVESLVRSLLSAYEDFQGIPLVSVFDNPKTIVLSREGSRIEWNPTFAQVMVDYRVAAELCTPAMANQKGSVENLVKWVKGSFFKVRRFFDRADLERQLAEWLREVNERRPSRATKVIPAARIAEERARLRGLAIPPAEYPLRFPVTVGPTAFVEHRGVRYSMPPGAIGMPGTLFLYPDRVRVMARHHVAEHPRVPETGNTSWRPEHRAQMLAAVSGERGRLYLKRQQILELGPGAEAFLTEVVHARPWGWKGDVETLYVLLGTHGGVRLLAAMREALGRRLYGAEYVSDLLQETA